MKKRGKLFGALLLAAVLLAAGYSRYMEPEMLTVKEITVETDRDIENCKVIFFTDTHFGKLYDESHGEKIAELINQRNADIVVFGGDLLDNYGRDRDLLDMAYLQKVLGGIKAKEGKFAVFGNHDYGGGAFRIYEEFMEKCGFLVLVNEQRTLEKYQIDIIGVDDYLLGQADYGLCRMQSDRFHLIISHEPVVCKFVEGLGDNLALAGHTHGGQVSVPFLTDKLLPPGSGQYVKGYYTSGEDGLGDSVQMYVSSGIGMAKYPFRFFNVPEIIEITIVKKDG